MEPINNVGVANYPVVVPQNVDNQLQTDAYASMPMVYEPEMEEKKKSSSHMLGLVALGAIALGTSICAYKQHGKFQQLADDAAKIIKENETIKASAKKAEEGLKKAEENLKEISEGVNKVEETVGNLKAGDFWGGNRIGKEGKKELTESTNILREKVNNADDNLKRTIDDLAQNAEKTADDVAEGTAKAVDDVAEGAAKAE